MSSAIWTPQYYQKVLALDPIVYWMLDEKSGPIAYDMVSGHVAGAQNGTHVATALGQPGIGDGRTSPLYDGATSYTDVYSATFAGAFNGAEGSMMCWARVSGAGVWTDGVNRRALSISPDGNNTVNLQKFDPNLALLVYRAGGVTKQALAPTTTTDWFFLFLTWSATADEVRGYFNGVQSGATLSGLGVWAGAPVAGNTNIGASSTVPAQVWDGQLDHCAIWDRALSPAEIADLHVVV